MTPIPLLSSRVFWRLYALFAIFSASWSHSTALFRVFWGLYALFAIFSTSWPHSTTLILGLLEAIRFICHFQYFMTPFHYFHLGFSGGYTLYLPFSILHDPIPLLSSRVFWRLYTLFAIFSASWPPCHYFHLGSFGGFTLYLPFSVLHDPIPLLLSMFFGGYTLYLPFSILHDPIPLLSSRVFWRLYALFAIFMLHDPHSTTFI